MTFEERRLNIDGWKFSANHLYINILGIIDSAIKCQLPSGTIIAYQTGCASLENQIEKKSFTSVIAITKNIIRRSKNAIRRSEAKTVNEKKKTKKKLSEMKVSKLF